MSRAFSKRFRKPAGIGFILLFAMITFSRPALAEYFTINEFHSDINISRDGSFTVKETIDVTFQTQRHGIFRDIPYKYVDQYGKTMQTPLQVLSVSNESGRDRQYKVSRREKVINIRIGDPKSYVNGRQVYVITYKVENALLFLDDHDELYWNVTGNNWRTPIKAASAKVFLPSGSRSDALWSACFTGGYGSKATACTQEKYPDMGAFTARRALDSGEGLTVVFGWEKGIVAPPSSWQRFLWKINLRENWIFALPFVSLLYMTNRWYRRGRDPKVRTSVTVMYEPPKFEKQPLIAGEVGCLVDEKLDPRDITSTIVGLAVKGYLHIEEEKKEGFIFDSTDYNLIKVKEPDPELTAFEKELMRSVFSGGRQKVSVSSMRNEFYKNLSSLKETLYGELVDKRFFLRNPEEVRRLYLIVGAVIAAVVGMLFVWLLPGSGVKSLIAAFLTGAPVLAFASAMPAKTRTGASARMEILGFEEFLNRAEKDKLERMGQDLFSKYLPYAIALDVADNWAQAFEGLYQVTPEWYVSPGGMRTFSPRGFSRSLTSMASTLGTAMYTAPRSSGSGGGGGGFSGGGFGGGGGGSW